MDFSQERKPPTELSNGSTQFPGGHRSRIPGEGERFFPLSLWAPIASGAVVLTICLVVIWVLTSMIKLKHGVILFPLMAGYIVCVIFSLRGDFALALGAFLIGLPLIHGFHRGLFKFMTHVDMDWLLIILEGIFLLIIFLGYLMYRVVGRPRAKKLPFSSFLLVFFIFAALSIITAQDRMLALKGFLGAVLIPVLVLFAAFQFINSRKEMREIFLCFVGAMLVTCLMGFMRARSAESIESFQTVRILGRQIDAIGGFQHSNGLAAQLLLVFPLLLALKPFLDVRRLLASGSIFWLCAFIFSLSMILTLSRTGWSGCAIILVVWILLTKARRINRLFKALMAAAVVLCFLYQFPFVRKAVKHMFVKRVQQAFKSDSEAYAWNRPLVWKASVRVIADHPFLGIGVGNSHIVLPTYTYSQIHGFKKMYTPHSFFLAGAMEMGLPAITAFLVFLAFAIRRGMRFWAASRDPTSEAFSRALLTGLAGVLYAGIFGINWMHLFAGYPLNISVIFIFFSLGLILALPCIKLESKVLFQGASL